jgi:hypothetical protein
MSINFPFGMLFVDPRTNQRLPGAQLSFFISTGSPTTPAPVYQDAALTIPFTQPIVADVNGNFAPVYLDPIGHPNLGVQLANSVGVPQWFVPSYFVPLAITTDSTPLRYDAALNLVIPIPTTNTQPLVINNNNSGLALRLIGTSTPATNSAPVPIWKIGNASVGGQAASFAPINNKPGVVNSTPAKWLPISFGGTTYYTPCFN